MQNAAALTRTSSLLSKTATRHGQRIGSKSNKESFITGIVMKAWKKVSEFEANSFTTKEEEIFQYDCYKNQLLLGMPTDLNTQLYIGVDSWPQRKVHTTIIRNDHKINGKKDPDKEQVAALFEKFRNNITEHSIGLMEGVYQITIKGPGGGDYYIEIKDRKMKWGEGKPSSAPDATFIMDTPDFLNLFDGRMRAVTALLMGKLKIDGNFLRALELENLLSSSFHRKNKS